MSKFLSTCASVYVSFGWLCNSIYATISHYYYLFYFLIFWRDCNSPIRSNSISTLLIFVFEWFWFVLYRKMIKYAVGRLFNIFFRYIWTARSGSNWNVNKNAFANSEFIIATHIQHCELYQSANIWCGAIFNLNYQRQ